MIKKLLFAAILTAWLSPNKAIAAPGVPSYPMFVAVASFTPSAAGTDSFAFFNASTTDTVKIKRIRMGSCTGATVTGGLVQWDILIASGVTNGHVVQVSSYVVNGPGVSFPPAVILSTTPTGVFLEHKGVSQLPMAPPCIVNLDETATTQVSDTCYDSISDERPLLLLKGRRRGIVARKRQFGAADVVAGCAIATVEFTVE